MKKLLLAALAAVFLSTPVMAASQMVGDVLTTASSGATNDTFDWGFRSSRVRLCFQKGATAVRAYVRFGFNATDVSNITTYATSSARFIDGASNTPSIADSALPVWISATTTSDNPFCFEQDIQARGIVLHTVTSGDTTADVWVFGR